MFFRFANTHPKVARLLVAAGTIAMLVLSAGAPYGTGG